ncbi:MAG: hypothetical protein LLF76_14165 [Planctomycetaceae bacterium]|nr:hypothetical protein [Planctomycetaceae bacterium]
MSAAAHTRSLLLNAIAALTLSGLTGSLWAAEDCRPCAQTAQAALKFGIAQSMEQYWQKMAACYNLPAAADRNQCSLEAQKWLIEATERLKQQNVSRLSICSAVGFGVYAPAIDPAKFLNFAPIVAGQQEFVPNRFFPLVPATVWEYITMNGSKQTQTMRIEVLAKTKRICGVYCIVVRSRTWNLVGTQEVLAEDTSHWYAQDLQGAVWNFGTFTQKYQSPLLVRCDGSWQAGQDGALPGLIMSADPQPARAYRQELLIGVAENVANVLSRGIVTVTVPFGKFSNDVLRTRQWSPLEPDVSKYQFYAPNVGWVLQTNSSTGDKIMLVDRTDLP